MKKEPENSHWPLRVGISAAVASIYFWVTNVFMFGHEKWTSGSFRSFFMGDQISYLAFVTNVANGDSINVEPFTETGSVYYPRGYYFVLGLISRITGASPAATWWIVGAILQVGLVFVFALLIQTYSRRVWTAIFAPLPLIVGTFAIPLTSSWYWQMSSHAVIWGPFAPLFTLNGEAAGMVLAGISLSLIFYTLWKKIDGHKLLLSICIAAGLIGLLANVQTYIFLVTVFIACYAAAAYGIQQSQRQFALWASIALIGVIYIAGPLIARHVGPLPALMFGLLPTTIGLALLSIQTRGRSLIPIVILGICAAPTVLITLLATIRGDDFLSYRTVSTVNLGVDIIPGLIGGVTLMFAIAVTILFGKKSNQPFFVAVPAGMGVAWAILSTNDRWGANQEPYRFWIDSFVVISFSIFPVFVGAAFWFFDHRSENRSAVAISLVAMIVYIISLTDFAGLTWFTRHSAALVQLDGPRNEALSAMRALADNEVVLLDTCISPLIYKNATGGRVASYNAGMAWPDNQEAIGQMNAAMKTGVLAIDEMKSAGVGLVLADDACDATWKNSISPGSIRIVGSANYDGGSFSLYRIE